jgi:hypothetical protein
VRIGEARQREVIVFYQEDLAHLGYEYRDEGLTT